MSDPRVNRPTGLGRDPGWAEGFGEPAPRVPVRWLRLRILSFCAALLVLVATLLYLVLVYVLPVPDELSALSRGDILLYSPLAFLALLVVVLVELRPVARAVETLRVGLRLTDTERRRALRTALSFPVVLPGVVLAAGTAGNIVALGLDVSGRTEWIWYSMHTALVTQCMLIAGCFPAFVYVRSVLRPVVRRIGGDAEIAEHAIGLRGRVTILVVALALLIVAPVVTLLTLQLDRGAASRRDRSMRELSQLLAGEAKQMGLHSFSAYVQSVALRDDVVAFVVDARGGVLPASAAPVVRRAGLSPPQPGQTRVVAAKRSRRLAVTPVEAARGTYAWVGLAYSSRPSRAARRQLLWLLFACLCVALLFGLLLGGGIARELRSVAGRIQTLIEGRPPTPLPGDVGAISEVGRIIDSINELLTAADRVQLRGFVAREQSEEEARSKTEFLANMSHDLKAPLTAIIGFTDFLAQGVNGPVTPAQRELVDKVLAGALLLRRTIDELLDTAKLDAGRLDFKPAWTPAVALVSAAVKRLTSDRVGGLSRRIRVEVQAGLAPIRVDPERTAGALALLLGTLLDLNPAQELHLHARAYSEGGDRGVQFVLGCPDGAPLVPEGEAFFDEVVELAGRRRLRLGPHLAQRLITKQRGRLETFVEEGTTVGFKVRFPVGLTGEMPAVRRR